MIRLLVPFLLVCAVPAHAFVGHVVPSVPMSVQAGTTVIDLSGAAAARVTGGYVVTEGTLALGARTVVVPIAVRVAGNAALFAVTKLNPYVAALSLAVGAYQVVSAWFDRENVPRELAVNSAGHVVIPGVSGAAPASSYRYYNFAAQQFRSLTEIYEECIGRPPLPGNPPNESYSPSIEAAGYGCYPGEGNGQTLYLYCGKSGGQAGFLNGGSTKYFCSDTGVLPPVVSPETQPSPDRLAQLAQVPISASVLPWLSPLIPVDPIPVVSPAAEPVGDPLIGPTTNPAPVINPAPFRVPNGDPVFIPGTNPPQYSQPWYQVTPTPTVDDPWKVEVEQVTTVTNSPTPIYIPVPIPTPSDCDKYPNGLGCADVDVPDSDQIPREDRNITLQQGGVFSGGACPADLVINVGGMSVHATDSATACGWIALARPVIILLAALSALTIIRPGGGKAVSVSSDD